MPNEPTFGRQIECRACADQLDDAPWCDNIVNVNPRGGVARMMREPPADCPVRHFFGKIEVGKDTPGAYLARRAAVMPARIEVSVIGFLSDVPTEEPVAHEDGSITQGADRNPEQIFQPMLLQIDVGTEHYHVFLEGHAHRPGLRHGAPQVMMPDPVEGVELVRQPVFTAEARGGVPKAEPEPVHTCRMTNITQEPGHDH